MSTPIRYDSPLFNKEDMQSFYHVVGAIVKDKDNNILMQDHVKLNMWTIPVGKVKVGDDIEQGLINELYEECGIKLIKYKLLTSKNFKVIINGNDVRFKGHLFDIVSYSGNIKNKEPEKHRAMKFMSINDILKLHRVTFLTSMYLEYIGVK